MTITLVHVHGDKAEIGTRVPCYIASVGQIGVQFADRCEIIPAGACYLEPVEIDEEETTNALL